LLDLLFSPDIFIDLLILIYEIRKEGKKRTNLPFSPSAPSLGIDGVAFGDRIVPLIFDFAWLFILKFSDVFQSLVV
jgi:hypothetical protein